VKGAAYFAELKPQMTMMLFSLFEESIGQVDTGMLSSMKVRREGNIRARDGHC
jgi:hypothetical protein